MELIKTRKDLDELKAAEIRALQQVKKLQDKQPIRVANSQLSHGNSVSIDAVKVEESASDDDGKDHLSNIEGVKTELETKVRHLHFSFSEYHSVIGGWGLMELASTHTNESSIDSLSPYFYRLHMSILI